ncbi:retroviral-like aspartic protease family protein [Methylobacillus caricis]|uniref:retropepsin-like aspartic protease family protein n=1 Tax=Methylobacillus caricis TaxID=1971611 RepID=UPI001D000DD6|nr:retropepsin-like aspartic protease [Methylobacillus caricis]MCB5186962.1 retroviral-like aspartic protease family protein [Methylobacillus caricis]
MSGGKVLWIAVWLTLAGGLYYLADSMLNPNKLSVLGEASTVTLQRGPDGHYRAEALINGIKVDVLVDTGATGVAISQDIADKLNLSSNHAIRTSTANGNTVSYMTRLESVRIGGVEAKNVAAVIAPGLNGDVLLGMSYLGRMDVRLFQGKMTITQVE